MQGKKKGTAGSVTSFLHLGGGGIKQLSFKCVVVAVVVAVVRRPDTSEENQTALCDCETASTGVTLLLYK